ncbi:Single-stranded DNA-binding protein 2 [Liparis tanakae]|uniref:Single-stranded DNA-binding protein 2 n=1 Tax=Liparis tanakae TaxID=230148 RepID=A0A4Z2EL18_9TELE|nr:Single-stranded DNA-binding protein 2 [Liparis tanakae]
MMNPIGPGGNRPNFPMGPGPDGPMGGMGAMEQHHMNGSLGEEPHTTLGVQRNRQKGEAALLWLVEEVFPLLPLLSPIWY